MAYKTIWKYNSKPLFFHKTITRFVTSQRLCSRNFVLTVSSFHNMICNAKFALLIMSNRIINRKTKYMNEKKDMYHKHDMSLKYKCRIVRYDLETCRNVYFNRTLEHLLQCAEIRKGVQRSLPIFKYRPNKSKETDRAKWIFFPDQFHNP